MWDPFREIKRLDRRMDRLMKELWGSELKTPKLIGSVEKSLPAVGGWRAPAVDVKEADNEVKVTAELPGINKEDIKIDVRDRNVEIKAETKEEKKEEKEGYIYKERRQESFYRRLDLPANVDADKTKATYKDGILTLSLPKTEKVKKTKIEIE
jgi:HSP20 family protein